MGGFGTPDEGGGAVVAPRPASEAPVSPGLPLIGNGIEGLIAPCRFFAHAHRALGPVFQMRYPGRHLVVLAGVEANHLLARPGGVFDIGATYARVTRELGTDRIPNAHDGEDHRRLRKLLAPSLSSHGIEAFVPELHEVVRARLDAVPAGSVRAAGPWLEALVADLVTRASLGRPAPDGLFSDLRTYGTAMGAIGVGGAAPEWVLYTPPIRRARNRIAAFVADTLEFHRRSPAGADRAPDLVDALLAAPDARDREPAALLALAMLPLKNAGIYLARMIGFALYEGLRHPELLERARAEVDAAWTAGPPDLEALKGCHTINGLVLEALRFWPMAIALPRVVGQPFTFAGYRFEPGQTVYVAGPVTHFLPELFDDPERFDPDRFGPGRSEHRRPDAFAPFGLGAHACLARGWSLSLASVVLAGLLRGARLELTPAGHRIRVWALPSPVPEARFRFRKTERAERSTTPATRAPLATPEVEVDQRRRVDTSLTDHHTPAGEVVFRQGDPADRFFQIREGEVEVVVEAAGAAPRVVARLGPGECFGEMGLLQGVPRTATVRVTPEAPLSAWTLDREAFEALVVEGDLTRAELVRLMNQRALVNQLARALPSLEPRLLARAGESVSRQVFPPGHRVVVQGEAATAMYLLLEGRVEVVVEPPGGGAPFVVATLEAVDHFGEIGLLEGIPRTATVRVSADGPATLLALDADAFTELVAGSDPTRRELSELAVARLVALSGHRPDPVPE